MDLLGLVSPPERNVGLLCDVLSSDSESVDAPTRRVEREFPASPSTELLSGDVVGRYVILERLGAGGMGVVYAAYDPELDRKVAIKLLHEHERASFDSTADPAQRRLLREAQAMARLDHVNVVSVHDVGEFSGGVYVAMELIDGETLGVWLARERPPWQEILQRFLDAAAGLSAAHAKGLIHRDFKPDNVMVSAEGRVRVMDFGLAREVELHESEPAEILTESRSGRRELATPLTEAGSLMGTPAYMAPEQHLREEVGPASDQFSFCVALWQAVYGQHPFGGGSRIELVLRVVQGEVLDPGTTSVPSWLQVVLERGLSRDAGARFDSMDSLCEAVNHGLQRARRRPIWAGLGALLIAGAGGMVLDRAGAEQRVADCAETGREILQTWSPQARESLMTSVGGVGVSYAADTAARTVSQLDDWVATWTAYREESCRADRVRGDTEPVLAERGVECFEERRFQLDLLLENLAEPDTAMVRELVSVSARLPRIELCADREALRRWPAETPTQRGSLRMLRRELSRVEALRLTMKLEDAKEAALKAVDHAEELGNRAYVARAQLALGEVMFRQGDYDEAEAMLRTTFTKAGIVDELETAARAAADLTYIVGYLGARPGEGLVWSVAQRVYVERIESEPGLWTAVWASQRGAVMLNQGNAAEAETLMSRALSIQQAELGPDHPKAISTQSNLAAIARKRGDLDRAVELQRRAFEATERAWGPSHPNTAAALGNLGAFLRDSDEVEGAETALLRAIEIVDAAYGASHPKIAAHTSNLAVLYYQQYRLDESEVLHQRTLKIARATYGERHPQVAKGLLNLALVAQSRGDLDQAASLAKRGADIMIAVAGPTHDDTLQTYRLRALVLADLDRLEDAKQQAQALIEAGKSNGVDTIAEADGTAILGGIEAKMGNPEVARVAYQDALAILERAEEQASRHGVRAWLGLAELALANGDATQALNDAEQGLARVDEARTKVPTIARAKFLVAQALRETTPGKTPERALTQASEAAELLRDRAETEQRQAIENWLAVASG